MLQIVTLYHVIKLGKRYVTYADDYVDYIEVDAYFETFLEAEFMCSELKGAQIETANFGYNAESHIYYKLTEVPRLVVETIPISQKFHSFKVETQQKELINAQKAAKKQSALSKLTADEKLLLNLQ